MICHNFTIKLHFLFKEVRKHGILLNTNHGDGEKIMNLSQNNAILYIEIILFCAAIIIYVMIEFGDIKQKNLATHTAILNYVFLVLLGFYLADALWKMLQDFFHAPAFLNYLSNILYFSFSSVAAVLIFIYCLYQIHFSLCENAVFLMFISLPSLIVIMLAVSSLWTGSLFYIDDTGSYVRGDLYFLQPLIMFSYLILSCLFALAKSYMEKNPYLKKRDILLAVYLVPAIVFGILQSLLSVDGLLVIGITVSMAFYLISLRKIIKNQMNTILSTLSTGYEELFYVNINTGTYQLIASTGHFFDATFTYECTNFFEEFLEYLTRHTQNEKEISRIRFALEKERILYELREHDAYYINLHPSKSQFYSHEYYQMKIVSGDAFTLDNKNVVESIVVVISNIAEKMRLENDQLDAMRELIRKEGSYQQAIYSDAMGFYEINLTRDTVNSGLMENIDGEQKDVSYTLPLSHPLRFSEFIRYRIQNNIYSNQDEYTRIMDSAYLTEQYGHGNNMIEVSFWATTPSGSMRCHRNILFLSKDEVSGDIMALVIVKDISEKQKKEDEIARNQNIIEILAGEYSSVCYVDLANGQITPYTLMDTDNIFTKTMLSGLNYMDSYEIFLHSVVIDEDREMMSIAGATDTIIQQLRQEKT